MARNILFIFAIVLLLIGGAFLLYGQKLQELAANINLDNSWSYHYYDKSVYNMYENDEYYVDFLYSKDYQIMDEINNPFIKGYVLTAIGVPAEYFTNTNLSEAYFILAANEDENLEDGCLAPMQGETTAGTKQIYADDFQIFKSIDAAAGNRYESTIYRLDKNDICYEAVTFLHYGVFENYDPSLGIKEFDRADVEKKLNNILMQLNVD
jgi:hypothetical protein